MLTKLENDEIAKEILKYTLDPHICFHFTRPDLYPDILPEHDIILSANWPELQNLLEMLRKKSRGHNILLKEIRKFETKHRDLVGILRRIINKDLRAGVGAKTVNKAIPQLIRSFQVNLAVEIEPSKLDYPVYAEPKYDGVRVLAIVENGRATLFSRSGKLYSNFRSIEEKLEDLAINDIVIDGEVISSDFQTLMTEARRTKRNKNDSPIKLKYIMFDAMRVDEFKNQKCRRIYLERRSFLLKNLRPDPQGLLEISPTIFCQDYKSFSQVFKDCIEAGFEGTMAKTNSEYKFGRSKTWAKIKPVYTYDFPVIRCYEGKGKHAKKLGGLVVDADGIEVNVGSGFSDQQRKDIWKNKEKWEGKIIEVMFQEKTKDGSLRFPRFIRVRDDK